MAWPARTSNALSREPGAVNCGYSFTLDTRTVDDGIHRVNIRRIARMAGSAN